MRTTIAILALAGLVSAASAQTGARPNTGFQPDEPGAMPGLFQTDLFEADAPPPKADRPTGERGGQFKARLLDRFDADGDGELNEDEKSRAKAAMREMREMNLAHRIERVMTKIQLGTLDSLPAPIAQRLAEFDIDDNRAIDDDERVLIEAEIDRVLDAKRAEMLSAFDADGDGQLSKDERQAALETKRAEKEAMRAELLAGFDADADGKLSADERQAVRDAGLAPDRDPILELVKPRRPQRGARGQNQGQNRSQRGQNRDPQSRPGNDALRLD